MASTLLAAVLAANEARVRGDSSARAAIPGGALPFVVTCMDPRLVGTLVPALGLGDDPPPKAQFAGGIIRPGDVSGVRSVLAAAIFNMATEVLVIGHTDCRMGKTSSTEIRNGLQRLGIRPEAFEGEDPVAWLGAFASERAAVQASVEALRSARRMPASLPVHGLLYHLDSRKVELIVDGYASARADGAVGSGSGATDSGYRPGPATLGAPPAPTFGAAGTGAPAWAAPPPTLGAPGGSSGFGGSGPVSLGGSGPVSLGGSAPSLMGGAPGFPEPPPPMPMPIAPPPLSMPDLGTPAPPEREDPPEPEEPPSRKPPSRKPPRRGTGDPEDRPPKSRRKPPALRRPSTSSGDSPFDRAQKVLERLRREKGK